MVVYEIAMPDGGWAAPWLAVAIVVSAVLLVLSDLTDRTRPLVWPRLKSISVESPREWIVLFAVFVVAVSAVMIVLHDRAAERRQQVFASALARGEVQRVEGPVTDFVPMPYGGHALERFCVAGTCFSYSDFQPTGGFSHTASHGGPIRAGEVVRVSYLCGTILRLEMLAARPPMRAAPAAGP
ncbi:hypothetical protein [Burkholderia sp. Ac-20379]|uniref:hypothetical protein n=1 Tax=Burkholderia sp. Ac-20379 TaxID=2703900 RepID=UPI001981ACEE|nr:hypothetical protein [Burkholderia sp. Ac-20379]MBN3726922.1 hypothetical protein [Burkholderia sp. Ac-20379]